MDRERTERKVLEAMTAEAMNGKKRPREVAIEVPPPPVKIRHCYVRI